LSPPRLRVAAAMPRPVCSATLRSPWSLEWIAGWRTVGAALSCASLTAYLMGVLSARALPPAAMTALLVGVCAVFGTAACLPWRHRRQVRETLIIGTGRQARAIHDHVTSDRTRRFLGFVDCINEEPTHGKDRKLFLGSLAELDSILMRTVVDEVIVA